MPLITDKVTSALSPQYRTMQAGSFIGSKHPERKQVSCALESREKSDRYDLSDDFSLSVAVKKFLLM